MSHVTPLLITLPIAAYFIGNLSPGLLLTRLLGHGDVREQGSGGTGATNAARLLGSGGFAAVLALDMAKGALAALLPVFAAALAPVPFGLAQTPETSAAPALAASSVPATAAADFATANAPDAALHSLFDAVLDAFATPVPADATRLLTLALACGLSAIAGHVWPALLGFRGGKGIGTFFGVWLAAAAVAWPRFAFVPLTLLTAILGGALLLFILRKGVLLSALCALPLQPFCLCLLLGTWKPLPPALGMVCILLHAHRENFRRHRKRTRSDTQGGI